VSRESLAGRHIAITGAASGIGLATATHFAAKGARVALLDRNPAVSDIAATVPRSIGVVVDVTSQTSISSGIETAARHIGSLDGIVNCAGYDFASPIADTPPEQWNRLLAVNMTGPFLVIRAALSWLHKAERATIVNVASGLGLRPLLHRAGYAASKAGLIMLSKALAMELGPRIRVNVACPGVTDTPMLRQAWPTDADIAKLTERYAIKSLPTAEDVAYSILFLTSEASKHITGIALASDGGNSYH
jgi:NAD(P)-dependent dehydrogenase (short-subunit alcohol dehydrogenase family)